MATDVYEITQSELDFISMKVSESITGVASVAEIEIENDAGTKGAVYNQFNLVLITKDGVDIFRGYITSLDDDVTEGVLRVTAVDKFGLYSAIHPVETYATNTWDEIITDLVQTKEYGLGTTINILDGSSDVVAMALKSKTLLDILLEFCDAKNQDAYFDLNQDVLNIKTSGNRTAPETLIDGTDDIISWDIPRAGRDVKNRVTIYGQNTFKGTVTTIAETVLTASAVAWTVDEFIGSYVHIDSGTAAGKKYEIDDNTATTLTCTGDTMVTDGVAIGDTFHVDNPIIVQIEDRASQEYYRSSANPLIREKFEVDTSLTSEADAREKAQAILNEKAWTLEPATVVADGYEGLNAGELIHVTAPSSYDIDANYLVVEKIHDSLEDLTTIHMVKWIEEAGDIIADLIRRQRKIEQAYVDETTFALKVLRAYEFNEIEDTIISVKKKAVNESWTLGHATLGKIGHITAVTGTHGWWNTDYPKRKKCRVVNVNTTDCTNVQAEIYVAYDSDMNSDFDDIRFVGPSGETITHWRKEYASETDATFWLKIPYVAAESDYVFWMYYGKASDDTASDFDNTFPKTQYQSDSNLEAEWLMDEGTGTELADSSPNTNTGNFGAGAAAPSWNGSGIAFSGLDGSTTYTTADALSFDGGDHVDSGTDSSLDFTTEDFSIEFVLEPTTGFGLNDQIFARGKLNTDGYYCSVGSGGVLYLVISQAAAYQLVTSNAGAYVIDQTHHYVFVRDGATGYIYKDGVDVTSTSGTLIDPLTSARHAYIGRGDSAGVEIYGKMDIMRLYSRALPQKECQNHYELRKYALIDLSATTFGAEEDKDDATVQPILGSSSEWEEVSLA